MLTNQSESGSTIDATDIRNQRKAVVEALVEAGHEVICLTCGLNLHELLHSVRRIRPEVVFNLVESLGGSDRLIILVPWLLDCFEIPYTGATSESILATTNKIQAKRQLRSAGLPTPDWFEGSKYSPQFEDIEPEKQKQLANSLVGNQWIVKPVWEHASQGMDDSAVVSLKQFESLSGMLAKRQIHSRYELFAERFIEGREFNVTLVFGDCLPPAEIDFSKLPPSKPHIVGHNAKWVVNSLEYNGTTRTFCLHSRDESLLKRLQQLSQACWRLFRLEGLARVDFRVDAEGQPWILEVNINPCLSPDAGLAAAIENAGLKYTNVIDQLVRTASVSRRPVVAHSSSTSSLDIHSEFKKHDLQTAEIKLRRQLSSSDRHAVRELIESTGFFRSDEVEVAIELVDTRLEKGLASGYYFLFAETLSSANETNLIGYVCFGPIACTIASWDIYWIAVAPAQQGKGIGQMMMKEVESLIRELGGKNIYLDTSGQPQYAPSRRFYERCGFSVAAVLADFYDKGDDKVSLFKAVSG